jgi:citrate lyase subunit beta/citryl-CoA lyase
VDGPYADFSNPEGFVEECRRAGMLGMVGKWAIHPSQIAPAQDIFSPSQEDVDMARELIQAYRAAEAQGIGSVNHKGAMVDAATARLFQNTVDRAELIGM